MDNFSWAYRSSPRETSLTSGLLKVVAVFCQATQGSFTLLDALRQTARLITAEVVSISRVDLGSDHRSARVLCHDAGQLRTGTGCKLDVTFARALCGADLPRAKSGSIWCGDLKTLEDEEDLSALYLRRRMSGSVVIALDRQNGTSDFLELHFGHPVSSALTSQLTLLGPILSDCWKKRSLGRFSESILSNARSRSTRTMPKNILSMENPCQLSRAEYRVCLLLARGHNNNSLVSELSITMATLRTHLRNIYAKTGTTSQTELILHLLTPFRQHPAQLPIKIHVA